MEDSWQGCTPDGKPPIVGQEYVINHARKGKFRGKVVSVYDPFATVEVTDGVAGAMMSYNVGHAGDEIGCRNSQCRMTPVS